MIQRIQSVYLLIAFIATVFMFFFPFSAFFSTEGTFYLNISGVVNAETNIIVKHFYLLTSVSGLTGVLIVVSLFSFKNLNRQMRLSAVAFLFNALLIGGIFYFADTYGKANNTNPNYEQVGMLFPFIILIVLILAQKAIKKDIQKLRKSQRLR